MHIFNFYDCENVHQMFIIEKKTAFETLAMQNFRIISMNL